MGGRSKSQTVGYRYSLGAHLALCHGPVDAIREIRVDDRTAWSIGTGQSSSAGTGVGALASYGTVAGMSATAAAVGDSVAEVTFPGTLAGIRLYASYDLKLGTDNTTRTVTVQAVSYDGGTGVTTWLVEPAATAFTAQSVTVSDAASLPSLSGGAAGGRIRINKPNLFGGESREGGIVGDIDVLMGGTTQGQNDYLAAQAGSNVPGYRGICSLVLRQVYLGLNPYLKPWAVRLTRILRAEDGNPQWYPEKAQIVPEVRIGDAAIYIAMDTSGSMSGSRMAAQRTAVSRLIAEIGANALEPNDIQIVTWNSSVSGTILRRNADAAAYGELKDWVDALPTTVSGGTDFGAAVSQAGAFFNGAGGKRRILIFVTDGEPSPASSLESAKATLAGLSEVDVFAFNIALSDTSATSQIDNTPVDGVPVVPAGDPDVLIASLRAAFGEGPDMNPAHIIRECLTNRDWGLGHGFTDIGPSFATAADALFAEGFGLSLLWQQESTIEDFIADVLKHIDAYLYVDRRSGRWELKLIRADYDPGTLPIFDETHVVDWGELGRREAADLVNSVTVKFSDARTDQTGSVSVTDTALVQDLGQVVSATVDYPGIRYESLAVRVAERDLRALSSPILSGEITVTRFGADLDPGDVIRLVSPRRGLEGVAVRIVEIDHSDGRANGVRLRIAEDVFGLGDTALVGGESGDPGRLILPPRPLARRWVTEAPYWLLVQELGHAQADALLDEDPDAGALVAAGERPSADALSAQVWTDSGTGYALEAGVEFVPTALLTADVTDDPAERVLPVGSWTGLNDVTIGTLAAIGDELVRIDGVSATTLTVGRGCLDTVPQVHPAGTPMICWQLLANASEARFAAGETVAVRMLPETGFGTLPLSQAPEDEVTLASRAIRPLPPGDLRGNGVSVVNPNVLNLGPVLLTWAHRDRLTQTSSVFDAYDAGDIGPEPGVTYALEIRWVDPDTDAVVEPPAAVIDVGSTTSFTLTKEDVPILSAPSGTKHFEARVVARRIAGSATYTSWQARGVRLFMPDGIKVAEAGFWAEFGAGDRLTLAEATLFVEQGPDDRLGIIRADVFHELGRDARLVSARVDVFHELGRDARLVSARVDIFIEVIP
ncbi:MAG: phage tail protein [Rhodobacteraceae bacterium]|nr:phage tail protein [Paracoccaceae bacterium]